MPLLIRLRQLTGIFFERSSDHLARDVMNVLKEITYIIFLPVAFTSLRWEKSNGAY